MLAFRLSLYLRAETRSCIFGGKVSGTLDVEQWNIWQKQIFSIAQDVKVSDTISGIPVPAKNNGQQKDERQSRVESGSGAVVHCNVLEVKNTSSGGARNLITLSKRYQTQYSRCHEDKGWSCSFTEALNGTLVKKNCSRRRRGVSTRVTRPGPWWNQDLPNFLVHPSRAWWRWADKSRHQELNSKNSNSFWSTCKFLGECLHFVCGVRN